MTEPTPEPGPAMRAIPGERRLAHPPSDRYKPAAAPAESEDPAASQARGILSAGIVAIGGALGITLLGGVLAVSSGLIVLAGATGWAVSVALKAGAGPSIQRRRRVRLAVALAVLAVALGQAGLWIYGRSEGGVLGPFDYLAETFGPLVPAEVAVAWVMAWVSAR